MKCGHFAFLFFKCSLLFYFSLSGKKRLKNDIGCTYACISYRCFNFVQSTCIFSKW